VHLRTSSLARAREFYLGVLGLYASPGSEGQDVFSAKANLPGLLVLTENRSAAPRPPRSTGLYHFALRYATRKELAHVFRRLSRAGYRISGASDHGVSEAIYLNDPDGNGVELYTDRPRSQWQWRDGQIAMVTTPLDLNNLLTTAGPESTERTSQVDLGHIHLHVGDLGVAERFYSEFLGFAVTQRSYPGALFFASGNYHHHLGVNTWAGNARPPADSLGLVSYRIEVPVSEILYCLSHRAPLLGYETRTESLEQAERILQIRDPNGNWLEVQVAQNAARTEAGSIRKVCPEAAAVAPLQKE